jgi:endonuclease III
MTHFADKVKRLEKLRLLLRRRYGEPTRLTVTHPIEHALLAILAEEATGAQAQAALERLHEVFVDLNDLRVSRPREIRETLGHNFPRSANKARIIPRILDQVFKHHNSMVWDFLETLSKTEVRGFFEKLEDVRPFVAATLARDCSGAHTFPVDSDISRTLARLGILDSSTQTEADMQGLLERAVKANRVYEMHGLLKRLAEDACFVEAPDCAHCSLNKVCPSAVIAPRTKGKKKAAPVKGKAAAKPAAAKAAATKKSRPAARKKGR